MKFFAFFRRISGCFSAAPKPGWRIEELSQETHNLPNSTHASSLQIREPSQEMHKPPDPPSCKSDIPSIQEPGSQIVEIHMSGGVTDDAEISTHESPQCLVKNTGPVGCTAGVDGNATATDDLINDEEASENINLAISLMAECKARLSISNLDNAIFLCRRVFERSPTTHPLRTDAMRYLASALSVRFMYTNQIDDLRESSTLRYNIVNILNQGQSTSHGTNTTAIRHVAETDIKNTLELAKGMLTDFRKSTSLDVLNSVIFLIQKSLPHLSLAPTTTFLALNGLVDGLYARFNHSYNTDISDLNNAISNLQDAIKCWTEQDGQQLKMNSQNRLCGLLEERFDLTGDITDLQAALYYLGIGTIKDPATDTQQQFEFASKLYEQFTISGDMGALNTAATLFREVMEKLCHGSGNYVVVVNNLAITLFSRFGQGGEASDLDEAIELHRQALDLRPPPHPDRPTSLNNLAITLFSRFEQGGEASDLDEAISLHRQALKLFLPLHPNQSGSLCNLAAALHTRFEQGGQKSDLDEAISLNTEALALQPPPHPGRSTSLNSLAVSLQTRFEQGGQQSDIDQAISLHRQALELRLPPHPNRSMSLNNLAGALHTRFEHSGQGSDLEEAIELHRQALDLRPPPHSDRSMSLNNLAITLFSRFEQGREASDLDKAISLHKQALELQLPPHPNRSKSLDNLARALQTRFQQNAHPSDLNEAIYFHRQALELRLAPHPERSKSLNNLAGALQTQFKEGGQQSDINEAISLLRQALALRPSPHPNRSHSLHNLAAALSVRSERGSEQCDLDEAMSLFSTATQYPFQHPSSRLYYAKTWIHYADQTRHNSAIHAYEAALQVLPQVAALSLDVASRQKSLTQGSDGLARDAARCAILSGNSYKAIEFLEAGRNIFWSQVLSLRSPFDQLRKGASPNGPELADKLQDIANELEIGSHRDVSARIMDNHKKLLVEQETSRLNLLNEEWETNIVKVRELSGFEDFLRPRRFSLLKSAASKHPVVMLIANDNESHCLVMTSTIIHHIPLLNLRTPILRILVDNIRMAVSQLPISRSFIDQTGDTIIKLLGEQRGISFQNDSEHSDGIFRFVLKMLWDELVKPIIDCLNIKKSDEMPILQWCPTGYFTFLPIHAAGSYDGNLAIDCAQDYFVSSYTPTIGMLLAEPTAPETIQTFQMMAVIQSQELRSTEDELNKIRRHVSRDAIIELGIPGSPARVEDVASRLSDVSIVHFACHGTQDPFKPLNSGLKLDDGLLRISRIMKEKMPNGSLAFLCACETAMGDVTLPDEAMSLAASLIFSGFRRVVATMWEMMDQDGPTIADAFYRELFRGSGGKQALEPDVTKSAYALHIAVKELRSQEVPFRRWVPFIHIGK